MTLFSSAKHAALSVDPEPWETYPHDLPNIRVSERPDEDEAVRYSFNPRPEFTRPLSNPGNLALTWVRTEVRIRGLANTVPGWSVYMNELIDNPGSYGRLDRAQVDHARKVLNRLMAHLVVPA